MISVTEALETRMSARAFTDQPVDALLVREILEKARRSPSGGNVQPWHVTVLGGAELAKFKSIMRERLAADPRGAGDGPGYYIYPKDMSEPYRSRRFKCGEDMHGTMGIARDNKAARYAFIAGNFQFWNAPIGMFFTIDRQMGPPQWSDLGMFILHSCPQEAWTNWHKTVGEFLALPPQRILFCGLALGYRDESHPVNRLRTDRAPLEEFVEFRGL
jgi:nitroreductase